MKNVFEDAGTGKYVPRSKEDQEKIGIERTDFLGHDNTVGENTVYSTFGHRPNAEALEGETRKQIREVIKDHYKEYVKLITRTSTENPLWNMSMIIRDEIFTRFYPHIDRPLETDLALSFTLEKIQDELRKYEPDSK